MHKHRTYPFRVKAIESSGEFTGYASVFDKMDWYGDVVRPGAFTKTLQEWAAKGLLPPLLWQHDSRLPLGPHLEMHEDATGLFVHAKLLIDDVEQASEAYALLKNKVISGMSIGFDVPEGGMEYDGKTNVWNLVELDLWENSLATFPANDDARVEVVKSALHSGKLPTPSEFEDFLRDAGGFSRKQAKHIAACGYTTLRDAGLPLRDAEEAKTIDLSEILSYLERRA